MMIVCGTYFKCTTEILQIEYHTSTGVYVLQRLDSAKFADM